MDNNQHLMAATVHPDLLSVFVMKVFHITIPPDRTGSAWLLCAIPVLERYWQYSADKNGTIPHFVNTYISDSSHGDNNRGTRASPSDPADIQGSLSKQRHGAKCDK